LNSAHRIVAVKETEHRLLMTARFPQWLDKVEFWEVDDIDCAVPEEALPHLEREVTGLLERLTSPARPEHS
jgi:protein-tyrosine phosphatase